MATEGPDMVSAFRPLLARPGAGWYSPRPAESDGRTRGRSQMSFGGALDIFQHLRQEDVQWILATAEPRTIAADGLLVLEDDPSDKIFLIADGLFDVLVFAGHQIKVGQLGPGEVIGESSWLDRKPISATVRAAEASEVLELSTEVLEEKLNADPGFATRFLRAVATLVAERLRTTTSSVRRSEWAASPRPAA